MSVNLSQPINRRISYDIDLKDFFFTLGSDQS